jgi:hypothetical protein
VKAAVDRKIDLDPEMPDDPALAKLTRQARKEVDAVQQGMYGP